MSLQIAGLLFVVAVFTCLFAWVFWPSNRSRFEANARSIFDSNPGDSSLLDAGLFDPRKGENSNER